MPKDATKNVDRYKVRGGQLNEFDYQQKQEDLTKASKNKPPKQKPVATKGASAKKLAARKAAKK